MANCTDAGRLTDENRSRLQAHGRTQSRTRGRATFHAMAMVGHKTESIYRRYAIVDEAMHRDAGEKLNAFATGKPAQKKTALVRQFKRRASSGR